MKRMVKVYEVEFMSYTNCLNDTVSTYPTKSEDEDIEYLDVSGYPFLVKEDDLSYYSKFGGGYKSITFVGNMYIESKEV